MPAYHKETRKQRRNKRECWNDVRGCMKRILRYDNWMKAKTSKIYNSFRNYERKKVREKKKVKNRLREIPESSGFKSANRCWIFGRFSRKRFSSLLALFSLQRHDKSQYVQTSKDHMNGNRYNILWRTQPRYHHVPTEFASIIHKSFNRSINLISFSIFFIIPTRNTINKKVDIPRTIIGEESNKKMNR